MIRKNDIQGFVLAGGKSSRMGRDKARMEMGGMPLVVRTAELLRPFVREVTVLGPPERFADLGFPVIADQWQEVGPLGALCTGLRHSACDWNIFLACDLPLLSKGFVQLLVDRIQTAACDIVAPRTKDGWHPLCAAYHTCCRTAFEDALAEKRYSIVALFDRFRVESITTDQWMAAGLDSRELMNMNTPEDWARVTKEFQFDRRKV